MHDPSVMALALIVSEKMTYTQKHDKISEPLKKGQDSKLNIDLIFTLQDVCINKVSSL